MRHPAPTLSIVVPAYNEAEVLGLFHARLTRALAGIGETWELVLVNDGSADATLEVMRDLRARDPRIAIVNLSRNFGKEIALTAGLDHARGEAAVIIDADLQDPPELIGELVATWRRGFDTVYARRRRRDGETWVKRATAHAFYRLMRRIGQVDIPPDTGDFRLISRRVIEALRGLRERHRFMKGLFAWVGYPRAEVLYDRAPREAGRSKWNYWKLWNLALEGITSSTVMPLKCATYLGLTIGVLAAIYIAQLLLRTVLFGNPVAGYPSLMAVVLFMGGAQLVTLGVIGEYLGRVFNETKRRPLYLVERHLPARTPRPAYGFPGPPPAWEPAVGAEPPRAVTEAVARPDAGG
jgi:glycosyltransferase involved in cell wall biosynthesis